MEDQVIEIVLVIVFGAIVIGGFALIAYSLGMRQRLRELAIRERIAMIERGLVPPPEADPVRFDQIVSAAPRRPNAKAHRYRSSGVMLMGLGFGLLILLSFAAGVPEVGIGLGGGLAALGAAVFLNGVLLARDYPDQLPGRAEGPRMSGPPNG